jgi:hypothetical protein
MDEISIPRSRVGARFRRRLVPLILAAAGLWGLTGCFYLPLPEHKIDGTQRDFRELLNSPNPKQSIRAGNSSRASVIEALGRPPYVTDDGRSIAYLYATGVGVWVWPACFSAQPAERRVYAVRFDFGEDDMLMNWETARYDEHLPWGPWVPGLPLKKAIARLNQPGSELRPATRP